jgi:hypothetical protein
MDVESHRVLRTTSGVVLEQQIRLTKTDFGRMRPAPNNQKNINEFRASILITVQLCAMVSGGID